MREPAGKLKFNPVLLLRKKKIKKMTVVEKSNFGGEGVTYFLKMRSGLAMSTMICLELKGFHCYSNVNFFLF